MLGPLVLLNLHVDKHPARRKSILKKTLQVWFSHWKGFLIKRCLNRKLLGAHGEFTARWWFVYDPDSSKAESLKHSWGWRIIGAIRFQYLLIDDQLINRQIIKQLMLMKRSVFLQGKVPHLHPEGGRERGGDWSSSMCNRRAIKIQSDRDVGCKTTFSCEEIKNNLSHKAHE